jgi:hypothetical protein
MSPDGLIPELPISVRHKAASVPGYFLSMSFPTDPSKACQTMNVADNQTARPHSA